MTPWLEWPPDLLALKTLEEICWWGWRWKVSAFGFSEGKAFLLPLNDAHSAMRSLTHTLATSSRRSSFSSFLLPLILLHSWLGTQSKPSLHESSFLLPLPLVSTSGHCLWARQPITPTLNWNSYGRGGSFVIPCFSAWHVLPESVAYLTHSPIAADSPTLHRVLMLSLAYDRIDSILVSHQGRLVLLPTQLLFHLNQPSTPVSSSFSAVPSPTISAIEWPLNTRLLDRKELSSQYGMDCTDAESEPHTLTGSNWCLAIVA
jgi:hypothetical protein